MSFVFKQLTRVVLASVLLSSMCLSVLAKAEADAKDEYDFSWLDPEKKIDVVQNRKYSKAQRFELVASGGVGTGLTYMTTRVFTPRLAYYVNENWGVSVLGVFASNTKDDDYNYLRANGSSNLPSVRYLRSFVGGSAMWVPFYGKFNFFNKIVYFDWSWEVGVGSVSSEIDLNTVALAAANLYDDSQLGFFWGTGQKYFLSRDWAIRLDFMALYYSARIGGINGVLSSTTKTNYNYYLTLGASYTF